MEFKGRTGGRQRQRGTSREVQDTEHNMCVLAQLKVTNMDLSVTTDYGVSRPHGNVGLTYTKIRISEAVNLLTVS